MSNVNNKYYSNQSITTNHNAVNLLNQANWNNILLPNISHANVIDDNMTQSYLCHIVQTMGPKIANYVFDRLMQDIEFDRKIYIYGNGKEINRLVAWYVLKKNCQCIYKYGKNGGIRCNPKKRVPSIIFEILDVVVEMVCRIYPKFFGWMKDDKPDSVNMNLYRDGKDSVGKHADLEDIFVDQNTG